VGEGRGEGEWGQKPVYFFSGISLNEMM
jgi:hypothetical protein